MYVLSIFTKALFFYSTKYSGTEIDREILAAALTWTSLSMDEALSLRRDGWMTRLSLTRTT